MRKLLQIAAFLILISPLAAQAPPSTVLDPSRYIDWTLSPALFTIPSGTWAQCVTTQCSTVTSAGTSVTAAQINSAIASAPANTFVLIGSGVITLGGCIDWAGHSHVVLRGNGPTNTIIKFTASCSGYSGNTDVNMRAVTNTFDRSGANSPGGSNALNITGTNGVAGTYTKGAISITVSGVGSDTPKVGTILFTDQADDLSPNNGWMQCTTNNTVPACNDSGGTNNGRLVGGVGYNQVQAVRITNCNGSSIVGTSCGAATTYTISPGLYANNLRTSQTPGAWWNFSSNLCIQCGLENITLDHTNGGALTGVLLYDCYQCWVTGYRGILGGARSQMYIVQTEASVIRNSYFFGTAGNSSGGGYCQDIVESSDVLIENNIYDQCDTPIIFEDGSGFIIGYNFNKNNIFVNPNWLQISYGSHDDGNMMNLWEGNDFTGISHDTTNHGASPVITYFRNKINGNQPVPNNKTQATVAVEMQANNNAENFLGNILGIGTCAGGTFNGLPADETSQCTGGTATGPAYHTVYQTSPGTSGTNCYFSIWSLGWASADCATVASGGLLHSNTDTENTMMRWANWDTVHAATQWNSTEASPGAGSFINANFTAAYFNGLAHTLPISFYYNSTPSWWGSAFSTPAYPPIGPDVSGGQLTGIANHAYILPARDCLEHSPLDITNYPSTAIIAFNPNNCYSVTTQAASPTFSPIAGTYVTPQTITITSSTTGVTICYTRDGSTPTTNGAGVCVNGTTLVNGGTVSVTVTQLLQAIATKSGLTDSSVSNAQYVISANQPSAITEFAGIKVTNGVSNEGN